MRIFYESSMDDSSWKERKVLQQVYFKWYCRYWMGYFREHRHNNTKRYKILHPVETDAQVRNAVLQIYRFIHEISIDDTVITYDGGNRIYEIGIIRSDVIWNQNKIPELPRTRSVQWIKTIQRDMVSAKYKGSLEALLTLFEINTYIANDMLQHAQPTELAFGNNK